MISYIKGTVAFKGNDYIVIENHGIGYQIKVPSRVLDSMESGENVMLHTYLYVREDVLALFGFSSMQELDTFQILLGISGIGPKAALSVLSTMTVEDLYYAVFSEDAKSIAKTPGIGPKGAKRMIIELKDKLNLEDLESVSMKEETGASLQAGDGDSISDTVQALTALGYSNGEAYRAVRGVSDADTMDAEQSSTTEFNRIYRTGESEEESSRIYRGCEDAWRSTGSCIIIRTSRSWKDNVGRYYRE